MSTSKANGHTAPLDAAQRWHRMGFRPIPVRAGGEKYSALGYDPVSGKRQFVETTATGKEAIGEGWQTSNPTADELPKLFNRALNVGALTGATSGAGHAVADLDCPESVRAAGIMLPTTRLLTGRQSAGGVTHRHYRASGPFAHLTLEDPDGRGKIVELLGDGHHCTVSGTYTKKGGEGVEPCVFGSEGEPGEVDGAELERAVKRLAAAVTVARGFPVKPTDGNRHDAGFAVIGVLLRYGYSTEDAARFMAGVSAASGSDELVDRTTKGEWIREAENTHKRLNGGTGNVYGINKFKELLRLSPKAVTTVFEWLGVNTSDFSKTATSGNRGSEASVVGSGPAVGKARPLPPWKPFPTHLLPPVLAEYVRETGRAMDCDEAYAAGPVIAAAGMAVGTTHMIQPKKGWREPCAFWIVGIGLSSTTKSPPYKDVEDMCQDVNDRLEREYEVEVCEFEQRMEEWVARRKDGEDPGEKPTVPALRSFIKSDVTIPALVPELKVNPRGILIGRDELIAWIGNFTRHSGKTGATELQDWLQLSSAGTVDVIRKTDKFRIRVRGVAVGVCGTTQPDVIAKALTPDLRAAGLFARLLPLYPPLRERKWKDDEVDEDTRKGVTDLIDKLFALEMGKWDDGKPKSRMVLLSPAAKSQFVAFYNRNGKAMYIADNDHRAAMGKIEGYALRFALLFHCCRYPDQPSCHPVSKEDMANAVEMAEWFIGESERVYQMLGESEEERGTRTLAEQIHRKAAKLGGRITVKQLQNSNSRKYTTAAVAEADLWSLVNAGFGTWTPPESTGKGGHAVAYYVPAESLPTTDPSDPRPDGGGDGTSDPRSDPRPQGGPGGSGVVDASGEIVVECDEGTEPVGEQESEESVVGSESKPTKSPPTGGGQGSVAGGRESEAARGFKWSSELEDGGPRVVTTADGLAEVWECVGQSERVGLDLETTGLDPRTNRVRLLSLDTDGGTFLVDCFAVDPKPLFGVLAAAELVGHNLAFDLGFLARLGFTPGRVADTLLASQVLDAGTMPPLKHGLADAAERHLGAKLDKGERLSDWSGTLTPAQLKYAADDVTTTVKLANTLTARLKADNLTPVIGLENRTLPAVVWMSSAGVGFDRQEWEVLAAEAEADVARLTDVLNDLAPGKNHLFGTEERNWNSPEQVKAAFLTQGIELASTDDAALASIDHPLAAALRDHRAVAKLVGTYGRAWLKHVAADGRVYPGWKQIGAERTGRMSCKEPNAQNLPRDPRYRRCFVAPPGRLLVKADYSQIELRLAAKISSDPVMLAAYRDGKDLHAETARAVLGKAEVSKADRQLAKALNFGLLYGMGAKGFAAYATNNYGVRLSEAEAAAHRTKFFKTYPGLKRWHRTAGDRVNDTFTVLGRRRKAVGKFTERLNSPVQGSGGDGVKAALALMWERRSDCPGAIPVLVVHDEIVVECDAGRADATAEWLKTAMVDGMAPFADPVPVVVDVTVGATWGS